MNTTALRRAFSTLFAAAAIVAAMPMPAEAIHMCPIRGCGGTDGDDPNGTSRTGLEIKGSAVLANGSGPQATALPKPVLSIKMCPLRSCGGGTDGEDPNGPSRTGAALTGAPLRSTGLEIGAVMLPTSAR